MGLSSLMVIAFSSVAVFSLAGGQDLRLVPRNNASLPSEGRVEIFYEGQWGTICDDFWDLNAASVACRQLGYLTAIRRSGNAEFGQGEDPIWLDNVRCTGDEANISDCDHNDWGDHNCQHSEDAGVVCSNLLPNVTVRLAGGQNRSEGRVEVAFNGEWGTICDDFWDLNDAKVICRQLFFSTALSAPKKAFFGQGTGPIWLDNVHCEGTETTIDKCTHNGWGENNCDHSEDVSVVCADDAPSVELRLAGGKNQSEGRVEMLYNEEWGTICDDDWDNKGALVVCRQLGYSFADRSTLEFGAGSGTIWLDNVHCTGNESSILECDHGGLNQHNCDHSEDIGVICTNVQETFDNFTLRLIGGDDSSGRVEVYYNKEWGTICNDGFDLNDGLTICHLLGFINVLRLPHYSEFGRGFGPIWVDQLNCIGNETTIGECQANEWGEHDCNHFEDISVHCTNESLNSTYFDVRLVNENNLTTEGRVEVLYGGLWGTVCDDMWDYRDAQVVCRQLGFPYAVAATSTSVFGAGEGAIWMDNVECNGTESHIAECRRTALDNINCAHIEDAGIMCSMTPTVLPIRLMGGTSDSEGRVEVLFRGEWGTVCNDEWDQMDANVVCRQLGYLEALSTPVNFGQGSGSIWFDNVLCTGTEAALSQCPTGNSVGSHNCLHSEDVSVRCRVATPNPEPSPTSSPSPSSSSMLMATSSAVSSSITSPASSSAQIMPIPSPAPPQEFDVRLVGGQNETEGRVEIFYQGEWGTVCDDIWDLKDATVVCQQLGYPVAIRRSLRAEFGEGSGTIWLDNVACAGTERNLSECIKNDWGDTNCDHSEDAGVTCGTELPEVELRLVGGGVNNETEGRVEVYYDGQWGTICDDSWDMNDAIVVCRQLGFPVAIRKSSRAEFGRGVDPIWLDNVLCSGNEQSLAQCFHNGWGDHNCGHSEDAGVVCATELPDVSVRLVGGNGTEGRVEVSFNGEWGTVCDDSWDIKDATVVCRMLGHTYAIAAPTKSHFGQGNGSIWLDDVLCTGEESSLDECLHAGWGENNCNHREDAGVICSAEQPSISLRLVGGANKMEGRLEVQYNNEWGTVCSHDWDKRDAQVACQQLGFRFATRSTSAVEFGAGNGTIMIGSLGCNGSESNLLECDHGGLGFTTCSHEDDVGIVCSNVSVPCMEGDIRLVSGLDASSGRVEICHDGEMGTVCDDNWDIEDVKVVCRQLGFQYALAVGKSHSFGVGFDQVWLDEVNCTGNEARLTDCVHPGWGTENCNHFEDAGAFCSNTPPNDVKVRLVNGTTPGEGRVEVLYAGAWGTVCNDAWNHVDAEVICRQLNFSSTLGSTSSELFGSGKGVIWMDDVDCSGNETSIGNCSHSGFGNHNCQHYEDVGVICEGEIPPIRLVEGPTPNVGRVELFFRGEWGTVCDDDWDLKDSEVVCRQLGYNGTNGHLRVEPGIGRIWLDNVNCRGDEEALVFCPHNGFAVHNCFHGEDVAVNCSGPVPSSSTATPSSTEIAPSPTTVLSVVSSSSTSSPSPTPARPQDFDVRLVGGQNETEGRVEIFYQGEWGTVCDDIWDLKDATVVCRQLGYPVAIRRSTLAEFGQGSGPIHLDNVNCAGDEAMLHQCEANDFGVNDCSHDEDAGVVCSEVVPVVSLRLVGGSNVSEGRVEVYYDNQWGTVCDDAWGLADARVVCRQLGYAAALSAPSNAHFGQGTGQIWLDQVECKGTENNIIECEHAGWGDDNCGHQEDASVVCADALPDVTMRLVGGSDLSEGRVEILYNEQWGTICDDDWDNNAALVVCRQLGYRYVVRSTLGFGAGNGTIWLDNIHCTGNESSILECDHGGLNQHNCDHSEDIGIICTNTKDTASEGDLRLVGGSDQSGRLEIYYGDSWGTICNDNWDLEDSTVACKQLGFKFALLVDGVPNLERSYGPIWLENVNCTGQENNLLNCQRSDWGVHDCFHSEDIEVTCTNTTPGANIAFQLAGGNTSMEGRVEVMYGGLWGTVCDDRWTQINTEVLCRQLNFQYSVATLSIDLIGPGEGPIWLDEVSCSGDEASIVNCSHSAWGDDNCDHSEDVAVWCANSPVVPEIRLRGGSDAYEGRVEVLIRGEWGTICDDTWDNDDADVVCRQLGYIGADQAYSRVGGRFGQGTGMIWFDNLACEGTETNILQCPTTVALGDSDCNHLEDAGLRCNDKLLVRSNSIATPSLTEIAPSPTTVLSVVSSSLSSSPSPTPAPPQEFDLRLVGGQSRTEGRVEIFYQGEWGTVCDDIWDLKDATVVCRQLGYPVAIRRSTLAEFGQGSGPIHLDNVNCAGDEAMLHQCEANDFGDNNCAHNEDAGVVCSDVVPVVSLRLVGGSNVSEGRVEVYYDNQWGTVCDDAWGLPDARVVCRQLGYAAALSAPSNARFGQGTGQIWLDQVECKGTENNIIECEHAGWGDDNCGHQEDASVVCADALPDVMMRLVGGSDSSEGRVEMLYNGQWGTICDDDWDNNAALVVCRQLGYRYVVRSTLGFGAGNDTIWLDNVHCTGNESSILECDHGGLGQHNCDHSEDIGIICSNTMDTASEGDLRLVGGSDQSGRLEIYHGDSWGTICNDNWDLEDSTVACKQLGFKFALSAGGVPNLERSYGPIWLENVNCTGQENNLLNCQRSDWGVHDCSHSEDIEVICTNTTPGANIAFRLAGGNTSMEGRIEVMYGGLWGTVCDDGWKQINAEILCRQLNFQYSVATLSIDLIGPGEGPIWLDEVSCSGDEASIVNCSHSAWGDDNCDHSEDVAVWCANSPVVPEVRLRGGSVAYEGRVEVLIRGEWGTICDDTWDNNDADVVCRQLGYIGADQVYSRVSGRFGQGTGRIWFDNLACEGTETNILQCPTIVALGDNDCSHLEDAGLRCINETLVAPSTSLAFSSTASIAPPRTTLSPASASSVTAPIVIALLAIVVIVVLVLMVAMLGLWVRKLQRRLSYVAKLSQTTELGPSSGKYAKFDNEELEDLESSLPIDAKLSNEEDGESSM